MGMQFKPATRQQVKLKLAIQGPSGSGKTLGALALATHLAPSGRIAVVDTENGSASLYADRFRFDTLELAPPYTSARYIEAVEAAIEAGYEVVVIDSLTHQWAGEGGILARKEEADKRPGSNSYTNWAQFTKEHTAFQARLLHADVHLIGTLRAKQDYVLETNERGKQTPRKVGLAAVQREGFEYEFSTVFELQMDHKAMASKDRTGLFADRLVDLASKEVGRELLAWLATGTPVERPTPAQHDEFGAVLDSEVWTEEERRKALAKASRTETAAAMAELIGRFRAEMEKRTAAAARDAAGAHA